MKSFGVYNEYILNIFLFYRLTQLQLRRCTSHESVSQIIFYFNTTGNALKELSY